MSKASNTKNSLKISGLAENNLKSIEVEIPHNQLVVVTGLSGSGKSTLAFDTIYAEGQRRYIETFSTYVRQFLDRIKQPKLTAINNVRPAIAIEQHARIVNSRATVGSLSDVSDYLRLLFANLAELRCKTCGIDVQLSTPRTIAEKISWRVKQSPAEVFLIAAPILTSSADLQGNIERLQALGFSRIFTGRDVLRIDEIKNIADLTIQRGPKREIIVVIDRVRGDASDEQVLDSTKQALSVSDGRVLLVNYRAPGRHLCTVTHNAENYRESSAPYTEYLLRPDCSEIASTPRPAPSLFSPNHPYGACPDCKGFGAILVPDPQKIVPDTRISIEDGAIHCWSGEAGGVERRRLKAFCDAREIPLDQPWEGLSAEQQHEVLFSAGKGYIGPVAWLKRLERKIYKMHVRVFLSKYRSEVTCSECGGGKLRKEALSYHVSGLTIAQLTAMPLVDLFLWVENQFVKQTQRGTLTKELSEVFSTLRARLKYLNDLQLSYLSLNRQARTLSGGEVQRVRLATALGSELVSTQFVLDEPSIGLHPRDTEKLIESIKSLAMRGNSVLVVEHDEECIRQADHVLALGPGAGKSGGEIVYSGPGSRYKQPKMPELSKHRARTNSSKDVIQIVAANARNLKNISFNIPLNKLVCLTGVSGSGKSTIVTEVIQASWDRYKNGYPAEALDENKSVVGAVQGFQKLTSFEVIDQSALAKSPRANIATYTGIWDRFRVLLASTEGAAQRKLSMSHFSFNTKGGRCPVCEGAGRIKEEMQFLSDVYLPCEMCGGKRFGPKVLEVQLSGLNAAELLSLTVDEISAMFPNERSLKNTCEVLSKLGLGHLSIGHSLSDLSGGEAQGLKLVPYIAKSSTTAGGALLIFDEPTTGLHTLDIHKLLLVFEELLAIGHSVLCVEHNLSVIENADYIIDIGPEGGAGGGEIVCAGTPQQIADCKNSYTGQFLSKKLHFKKELALLPGKSADKLIIRGAREHNLKNIDVTVPLNEFVAITGVSGSGKSTLAKDIIFAEGQRRYLDCLSPYARQFIQELGKPDLDEITGVMPTVYVGQHMTQPSRYSTVGTLSEVYNFLRLMYAKVGVQYCHEHPTERISAQDQDEMAEGLKEFSGKRVRILSRIINQRKGSHVDLFEKAIADGITEVRVDGVFAPTSSFLEGLTRNKTHTIDLVLSHFNPKNFGPAELKGVVAQALEKGTSFIVHDGADHTFSIERACNICKRGYFKPDPEDFSFSSGRGRCAECNGLGVTEDGTTCQECDGERLGPIGRSVKIKDLTISQLCRSSVLEMNSFISSIKLNSRQSAVVSEVVTEISARLKTLIDIGLRHLGMDQLCSNLSSGELNRLRLAAALGSPLSGVMYVLDEPSAGLHPNDNHLVLEKIGKIAASNNSVLMIEHDEESILAANHVIEVGPGGGRQGGNITYNGPTKRYKLSDIDCDELTLKSKSRRDGEMRVKSSKYNNLKDIDISIPLNSFVTFAGVSGAGKSSLLYGVIGGALADSPRTATKIKTTTADIHLSEPIHNLVIIDHKPIGKNSRSTPVSYLEIWDDIRKVFAGSLEAKAKGYGQNFFSFNTGIGRCQSCLGQGTIDLEMGFLAEARVTCEACRGLRFGEEAQGIRYKGLNISQVLALTFEEARTVFANHRRIHRPIHLACELGLGYLTLGQSSATLSGGEAQRIKLVSELAHEKEKALYLLDEPTTGLHRSDVSKLVRALRSLVDKGNSVFVIEHDPIVIRASDHVVELGPGPGKFGGEVVFSGTVAKLKTQTTPWGKILSSEEQPSLAAN